MLETAGFALITAAFILGVFSYLLGDNPAYRLATYTFIGVAAGYAVVIAIYTVIWPLMMTPMLAAATDPNQAVGAIIPILGFVGGLLLMVKSLRVLNKVGALVVAFLVGVGAAVAVGGAMLGTLLPQTTSTFVALLPANAGDAVLEKLVEGGFILLGTLTTLGFFHYGSNPASGGAATERHPVAKPIAAVGQIFIGIAFGVMYMGAIVASLALFSSQLSQVWQLINDVLQTMGQ